MEHSFGKLIKDMHFNTNPINFLVDKSENSVIVTARIDSKKCAFAELILEENRVFLKKISVVAELQNKGIGSQLLAFCEDLARESQIEIIYAQAQENVGRSVLNFYTKNEYFCGEEVFFENSIPHKIVWKILH